MSVPVLVSSFAEGIQALKDGRSRSYMLWNQYSACLCVQTSWDLWQEADTCFSSQSVAATICRNSLEQFKHSFSSTLGLAPKTTSRPMGHRDIWICLSAGLPKPTSILGMLYLFSSNSLRGAQASSCWQSEQGLVLYAILRGWRDNSCTKQWSYAAVSIPEESLHAASCNFPSISFWLSFLSDNQNICKGWSR